jgi:hypothetical protein
MGDCSSFENYKFPTSPINNNSYPIYYQ